MAWRLRKNAAHKRAKEPFTYVVVGGFGCSRLGYFWLCRELRKRTGQRVAFIGSTRVRRTRAYREHDLPRVLIMQARYVITRLQRHGDHKVVLVGHSLGALVVMLVTALHPELVTRVIPVCPPVYPARLKLWGRMAIKIGVDGFRALIWDNNLLRRLITAVSVPGFVWYFFGNIGRTVTEGWQVSYFPAFELLYHQVKAAQVEAPVFYAEKDLLFPERSTAKALAEIGVDDATLMEGMEHDVQFHPKDFVDVLEAAGQLRP